MTRLPVVRTSLSITVAALVALVLPVYAADDAGARVKAHEDQMMKGKDHFDAQRATHQEEDAATTRDRGKAHERAMNKGKDHFDAQRESQRASNPDKVRAKAKEHERQMMKGKDHAAAWRATDELQDNRKSQAK